MDKSQHPDQNQMMLHSPSRQQLNYIPILRLKFSSETRLHAQLGKQRKTSYPQRFILLNIQILFYLNRV